MRFCSRPFVARNTELKISGNEEREEYVRSRRSLFWFVYHASGRCLVKAERFQGGRGLEETEEERNFVLVGPSRAKRYFSDAT